MYTLSYAWVLMTFPRIDAFTLKANCSRFLRRSSAASAITFVDQYDVILGAPWLNENKALLDFESHVVKTRGKGLIKTLMSEEDHTLIPRPVANR